MAYRVVGKALSPEDLAWAREQIAKALLKPGPGGSCIKWIQAGSDGSSMTLVALWPSRQIVAHTDPPIAGKRYHIPIDTNDGCWVFHDGSWTQLQVGEWYEMDPTVIHGAVNWGSTVRVHLMVDTA